MSEASSDDADKPMEQPNKVLPDSTKNLSVTKDDSDETSTPPKNLSDMPIHVVGLIIERSDYKQQLKLRKVSKSLRALVDNLKPACKSIKVDCSDDCVSIKFDDHIVEYTLTVNDKSDDEEYEEEDDVCEEVGEEEYEDKNEDDYEEEEKKEEEEVDEEEYEDDYEEEEKKEEKEVDEDYVCKDDYENDYEEEEDEDNFKKIAFDNLASTLKNPRLQLDEFSIVYRATGAIYNEEYNTNMRNVWQFVKNQLSVKEVKIHVLNPSWLILILPYLKPGVLEKISLNFERRGVRRNDSTGMEQIASLEQWKQAETLEFLDSFDRFPMEYATHFKRFIIVEHMFDANKIARIRDYLSKLDNFEHCTLFHHPITDSDYYFEFKKAKNSEDVEIERKKREGNR